LALRVGLWGPAFMGSRIFVFLLHGREAKGHGEEERHRGKTLCFFLFFVADAVGAGAVGWGIDCDYSALRKEGRGKQSIASWPAVPLDSCPPIVVGGGARHMVGSHSLGISLLLVFARR
jgi:hypothetical protein